mmetsp:Transcript_16623/g.36867  ORF Transcript_16623/g.36867 Transcript_16623/m.36867 type:complete len:204 (-) Transcript_16623:43-654(-)
MSNTRALWSPVKSGNSIKNVTFKSPFTLVFEFGMPSPGRVLTLSGVTLRAVIFSTRPSRLVTVLLTPDNASESVTRQTWLRLSPSLEKSGCGLVLRVKITSPGVIPGPWSPSLSNVILVPSFQPGLTTISLSEETEVGEEWGLWGSTFLEVMRIRLVVPLYRSSRVTFRSCVTGVGLGAPKPESMDWDLPEGKGWPPKPELVD